MRGNVNDKRSKSHLIEVAAVAAAALLFMASFAPSGDSQTSVEPPAAAQDIEPAPLEPALRSLDGVTHHG